LFTVSDSIHINAPMDRCFLLATHVGLTAQALEMQPVAGTVAGTLGPGDRVVWTGWRFGLPLVHEGLVTRYERPAFFQDTMARGRFRKYQHDHQFTEIDGHTLVVERLRFSMPFGPLGRQLGKRLVVPAVTKLLRRRVELLRQVAESYEWRRYLDEENIERSMEMEPAQTTSNA